MAPSDDATTPTAPLASRLDPIDAGAEMDLRSGRLDFLGAALPHHPRPELGVLELFDQGGDVLLVAPRHEGVDNGGEQRQVLYALRGPVGLHLRAGMAPHLLGVGLEEVAVEAPPEAGRDPPFEVGLVLRRIYPGPQVGQHAAHGFEDAQVGQRVHRFQRVVVKLAPIEDAALAGPQHEVLVGQDLVPQVLDRFDLREEAVAADVEAPPVALDGPADAPHHVVTFEDGRPLPAPGQLVGGRQPCGSSADDHDIVGWLGVGLGHVGGSPRSGCRPRLTVEVSHNRPFSQSR